MTEGKRIVCRCEDITYEEVVAAIEEGYTTLEEIKRVLRCGMGTCQGRTCSRIITGIIARMKKIPPNEIKQITKRPPLRPIPIKALIGEKDGENR
ncbi:MAG: (2Fe-2S)-binding protein [Acidobacteria bacterium]|nr:(2Fe-2S)-binding protein [Acidobacteriota bacterium]